MKLPSLIRECSWVWSEDPALDAPADPPAPDATDEVKARWAERVKEWERRLETARDTGQWDALVKPGSKLTKFTLRIIPETLWRKLMDAYQGSDLGANQTNALAVRLALTCVSDLDGFDGKPFKIELRHEEGYGSIATVEILDLLAAYLRAARDTNRDAADPIGEMAAYIARRQSGLRPL